MVNRVSSKGATMFMDCGQAGGILTCFSRENPASLKKVIRSLILDSDSLFHVVVNPPPFMPYDDFSQLEEASLKSQWEWLQAKLENVRALSTLSSMFEDFIVMPERTEKGNIHIHCLCNLNSGKLDTDIPKMFWALLGISLKEYKDRQRKAIVEHMVNVKKVENDGIIDYLFEKDKKDYETIYKMKDAKGEYMFKPFMLSRTPVVYDNDSDSE